MSVTIGTLRVSQPLIYLRLSTVNIMTNHIDVHMSKAQNDKINYYQSGISLNLKTGPTGHATLFNQ